MNQSITVYLVIGLAGGLLSGFFGVGGGALVIPALVVFAGMSQHTAQGTSLAALIPPVGLLGAYRYYKTGDINVTAALCIALGIFLGAYFGAERAAHIPDAVLKKAFALFLLIVSIRLFLSKG